jgi:hypothetical protein
MTQHRIFGTPFGSVYPLYVAKAERKGRSQAEVDAVLHWLTGLDADAVAARCADGTTMEGLFATAPALNPARMGVTGVVCGVRVEAVEDPAMREIRILDRLVDERAKGRTPEKALRPS